MIYLIGGPGRSGKTALSWRLTRHHSIPFFSLDYLMMGLYHGAPGLSVNPNHPEPEVTAKMWPVCKPMLVAMLENHEDYCVEGFALTPENVSELMALFPDDVRACFLGFCTADPQQKLQNESLHRSTNTWMLDHPKHVALEQFAQLRAASIALKNECSDKQFAFFDTSTQFEETLNKAEQYLLNGI